MVFGPIFKSALRGGKSKFFDFFFIGASATKKFAKSNIFRYGLPLDILSKRQKTTWIRGLNSDPDTVTTLCRDPG